MKIAETMPTGAQGMKIDPERVYTEEELMVQGLFSSDVLRRARETEGLKAKEIKRGKRVYRGQWLVAWLEGRSSEGR